MNLVSYPQVGAGKVNSGKVGVTLNIIVTDHQLHVWPFLIGHSLVSGCKPLSTLPF